MIDRLPDNVLLETFDFFRLLQIVPSVPSFLKPKDWNLSWVTLTQVCRRWRYIVLGSPRRLHLRVLCTPTTPTRMLPDIRPPFPITIYNIPAVDERSVDNLTAAVEHRDRISQIYILNTNGPVLERLTSSFDRLLSWVSG
jgi:hypothetical protein